MSEKEKNCGSCKHFRRPIYQESELGRCVHPKADAKFLCDLPICVGAIEVHENQGTDCPCHEPMRELEMNLHDAQRALDEARYRKRREAEGEDVRC